MVTISQAQQGLTKFIDFEILPSLSALERAFVGGTGGVIITKLPTLLQKFATHPMASALELYDQERGLIDIDSVYNAVKPYVGPDPIPVDVPIIGLRLKITKTELDSLYTYIKEAQQ